MLRPDGSRMGNGILIVWTSRLFWLTGKVEFDESVSMSRLQESASGVEAERLVGGHVPEGSGSRGGGTSHA